MLSYPFMQRALVAAFLVGLAAPAVGTYLVQRRLALIGDGMGHIALTGVALALLTGTSPVPVALATAILGAVAIELVRWRGRTSADLALAIMFYGGIAGGVVLIDRAPGGTPATLTKYLFGSISTTSRGDLAVFAVLTVLVLVVALGLSNELFAISHDEEYAAAAGMPVLRLNLLLAVMTAVTVVVSMRIVGLLLISALMVVPVATAQLVGRSFRSTLVLSMLIGVVVSVAGVALSFEQKTQTGGTIVLLAIALFAAMVIVGAVRRTRSVVSP
ncbi:MAG: metal ABC transporter permease [Mycobacteriales bacterium]